MQYQDFDVIKIITIIEFRYEWNDLLNEWNCCVTERQDVIMADNDNTPWFKGAA